MYYKINNHAHGDEPIFAELFGPAGSGKSTLLKQAEKEGIIEAVPFNISIIEKAKIALKVISILFPKYITIEDRRILFWTLYHFYTRRTAERRLQGGIYLIDEGPYRKVFDNKFTRRESTVLLMIKTMEEQKESKHFKRIMVLVQTDPEVRRKRLQTRRGGKLYGRVNPKDKFAIDYKYIDRYFGSRAQIDNSHNISGTAVRELITSKITT